MSALTLVVFLFFINLLQTCIQENMATTGPSMLMMVATNRSRPLIRPSRELHQSQERDIDAVPGPGVYWDTNVLIHQKGDHWSNCSASEQRHTISLESDKDERGTSNTIANHDEEKPAWVKITDYDDYQEDRDLFSKSLKSNKRYLQTGEELSSNTNSFLHKQLQASENDLTHQKDESSNSESDKDLTATAADHSYQKYYKEGQDYEFPDGSTGWDYYHHNEYNTPQADFSTPEFVDGGSVNDRYELEESENLHPFTNTGNYVWKIVTTVSNAVIQRFHSGFDVAQCYDLVVCEAHRVGRAWGDKGLLLASSLSEIFMWLYGEDDEDRRLISKAAVTGRQRQSCRVQMQQCENRSGDKSVLPAIAIVLEQFL